MQASSTPNDWSKPRPSSYKSYNETVGNSQTDGIATVGLGVEIADYIPRSGSFDYDALRIKVTTSANTRVGIQYALVEEDPLYDWCDVSEPTNITSDNGGIWLDIGFFPLLRC